MRSDDKVIFASAARHFEAWILVRRTNPASIQYIGKQGYTPKRIDCKAKTADQNVGRYHLAGLVVDATQWPNAFQGDRMAQAQEIWANFYAQNCLGNPSPTCPYSIEQDDASPHYGCVKFHGEYIHGDYDLYDVILEEHPRGNLAAVETLHGQRHLRGPRLTPIQEYVNRRLGIPMVQHGGEMQYTVHSEQSIDVFGPRGEQCTILNEYSIRAWYRERFQGRVPLEGR